MYLEHFGLNAPPFRLTPDTQMFFGGGKRGLILEALLYAVNSGEAIVKVVGEVGSGKTMLCRMLAERLPPRVEYVYLVNPRLTPDTILQAIALELSLPVAEQSAPNRLQLLHALHEALLQKHMAGKQVVVLIEEAQSMPLETLEEIRLLSNLETTRSKLLQIVLFGQPELDDNLAQTHIRQLKERITHNLYLPLLRKTEIAEYLDFRMRAVGYRGPTVFGKAAISALGKVSQGVLRRVNILADKALLAAFVESAHFILPRHVRLAARDSGFSSPSRLAPAWLAGLAAAGVIAGFLIAAPLLHPVWERRLPVTEPVEVTEPAETPRPSASSGSGFSVTELAEVTKPAETPRPSASSRSAIGAENAAPVQSGTPLLAGRLAATRQWRANSPADHYTLQVLQRAGELPAELEKLLADPSLEAVRETLYLLREESESGPVWTMFYAQFPDYASARQALDSLPPLLARNRPFARRFNGLPPMAGTP